MTQTFEFRGLVMIAAMTLFACGAPESSRSSDATSSLVATHTVAHRDEQFQVPTFVWLEPGATPPDGATAQDVATRVLGELAPLYQLSPDALAATSLRSLHDTGRGAIIAHFDQHINGLPIFRLEISIALDRTLRPVAASGYLAPRVTTRNRSFIIDEKTATGSARAAVVSGPIDVPITIEDARATTITETRTNRIYFPRPEGLVPAYYIELDVARGADARLHSVVVSAVDGRVLFHNDLTANDANSYRVWADTNNGNKPWDGPQGTALTPHPTGMRDGTVLTFKSSQVVTLQNAPFSRNDPWLPAGATEARGNNAIAYADLVAPDGLSTGDQMLKTSAPGSFDYSLDVATQDPATNATTIAASTTNLFYIVNFMHDYFYDAGWDESARNPQQSNYGRGGIGGDPIRAEAQDYSERGNANAATPADGSSPRIQMFLFEHSRRLQVTAPAGLAADYENGSASFGMLVFDLTADTVIVDDGTAPSGDGCETPFVNAAALAGKIAIIDRGSCNFDLKVQNAQVNGAVGAVIVNNDDSSAFTMAKGDPPLTGTVSIPSLMIGKQSGDALKAAIGGGMTVTVHLQSTIASNDSSLDGHIVSHEWGHIMSNRLVGNANGLGNAQGKGLGEGWSDFIALLTYVRPEDAMAAANTNWNGVYPFSPYSEGPGNNRAFDGSRRYPYSADLNKNPLSLRYLEEGVALPATPNPIFGRDGVGNSEQHSVGEVWASMLFDCYIALLRDTTRLSFAQANRQMRDYLVAALKLTPINPTLLEARDAILAAAYANSQADYALFAQAFARRGAGSGAIGPSRGSTDLSGITESTAAGADFAVMSINVDDSVMPCDRDGVLDNNEVGRLRVTLRNIGTVPLMATANVASNNPNVVLAASTLTFPTVQPYATTTATVDVHMQGAALNEAFNVTLMINAANKAVPGVVNAMRSFHGNYDVVANQSATDSMEDRNPVWNVSFDSTRDGSQPWHHDIDQGYWSIPDTGAPSDHYLISPPLQVAGTGNFGFTLHHRYSFEYDSMSNYDGGVIEISDDNGQTWQDTAAALTTNGYSGQLYASNEPLSNRMAFTGESSMYPSFADTVANFGTAYQGKTVRLRFRVGTDEAAGAPGWDLDSIQITGITNMPFSQRQLVTAMCVNKAPVVKAGPDQTVLPGAQVTLAGEASDGNDDPLTYRWTQSGGPTVTLDGAQSLTPTFTAPDLPTGESVILTFTLVANDGYVDGDPATVHITVSPKMVPTPPTPMSVGCAMSPRAGADGALFVSIIALALILRRRRALVFVLLLGVTSCGNKSATDQIGIFVVKSGSGNGTVTSQVDGNTSTIDCGTVCAAVFPSGTVVTLTATADEHSQFTGWQGACSGTNTICTVTLDQSRDIEAIFNGPTSPLVVEKSGGGGGLVKSSPAGIDCGATCQASFPAETVVTLTAQPDLQSVFAGWSGDCQGFSRSCVVRANSNRKVTAKFLPRICSPDGVCFEQPLPTGETLHAIAAVTDNDMWVAGERGVLLHWDGQAWRSASTTNTRTLRGLFARATNDIWAAGDGGTVLHYDGSMWSSVATGMSIDLHAVYAAAANAVYFVGASGSAYFYNGTTITTQSIGAAAGETLYAVHGSAANNVFVSSDAGNVFHWDGSAWSVSSVVPRRLLGVWVGAANRAWTAGDEGAAFEWDGTMWHDRSLSQAANLRAVFGTTATEVFALSDEANIMRFDGTDWSSLSVPDDADLRALSGSASSLWMAGSGGALVHWDGSTLSRGGDGSPTQSYTAVWGAGLSRVIFAGTTGRIGQFDGNALTVVDSGVADDLLSVSGSDASNIWIVGKNGAAVHYDGATWTPKTTGTARTLFAVWTRGPADTWAVGELGTVLHHDGISWKSVASSARDDLYTVWSSRPDDVYVTGRSEQLHFDGNAFAAQTGLSFPIYALSGRSANDIWAAGAGGALFRFDGTSWRAVSSGTTATLRGIAFTMDTEVWLVGEQGVILRGGADPFTVVRSGTDANIYGAWSGNERNLWLPSAAGVLSYRR